VTGGFFRELAARAFAPRGAVHPVSAAPYAPRDGAALPDSAVWPGAAPSAGSNAEPQVTALPLDSPDALAAQRAQGEHARRADPEVATPDVRTVQTELRLTQDDRPAARATRLDPASIAAALPDTPPSPAPAETQAPRISTPLRPAAIAARIPVATAPRKTSPGDVTQPAPEVHIHIGRIELTAAPAPTPAKKPREAPRRRAMSLDEYLQQRGRR
jgi:hypothetical protein